MLTCPANTGANVSPRATIGSTWDTYVVVIAIDRRPGRVNTCSDAQPVALAKGHLALGAVDLIGVGSTCKDKPSQAGFICS